MSDANTTSSNLSLYQTEWCPFCVRVRSVVTQLGLELDLRDISNNDDHLQDLVTATGRQMVPCLRIDSDGGDPEWMHESAAIITYLNERFA